MTGTAGILLHMLSNTGTRTGTQVLACLPPELRRTAFNSVIFDCCPSDIDYAKTTDAVTLPLEKSFPLRHLATPVVYAVLRTMTLAELLSSYLNKITEAYRRSNSTEYFSLDLPRLYVYSAADGVIPVGDVETHIELARRQGYEDVRTLRFETGGHCSLLVAHREKYWAAIQSLVRSQDGSTRAKL
jgi:pimeloyl-ACP methyl ester carboxylesterase